MVKKSEEIYVLVKLMDNTVLVGRTKTLEGTELVLEDFRMAVYWDTSTKGLPGLCSRGPGKGCRVSPSAEIVYIPKKDNVRFYAKITSKAWASFESEPWG